MRLLDESLRLPVERLVSEYTGRKWSAASAQDMAPFSSHPAAILSDPTCSVFVKLSEAANGLEQFEIELAGLRLLAERAGILTPTPIGTIAADGGALLVLEAVEPVERGPRQWRDIGQVLARIHQVKGDQFGLDTQGYFGPLPQDNRLLPDWATFYAERRLRPMLRLAVDGGKIPGEVAQQVETLIARMPRLCGPEVDPTLLHGDAQQNNFISTAAGAVAIDPAVYYGHPEMDLALLGYFEPVPEAVFDGYRELMPIDAGFRDRCDLWRVYGYLACVAVEGPAYMRQLAEAVQKYL